MNIFEKNLKIFRELGIDRFEKWLSERLLYNIPRNAPFTFPSTLDFESVFKKIYGDSSESEKVLIRWVVSSVAMKWEPDHGLDKLNSILEYGNLVGSKGVFLKVLNHLDSWKPNFSDLNTVIRVGEIVSEIWNGYLTFQINDYQFDDTPFYEMAQYFKLFIDAKPEFKVIDSPLFRVVACLYQKEWPYFAAKIARRYAYNDDDVWPKKFAGHINAIGQLGFYDLSTTFKEAFSQMSLQSFLDGCKVLEEDLLYSGGFECRKEIDRNGWVKRRIRRDYTILQPGPKYFSDFLKNRSDKVSGFVTVVSDYESDDEKEIANVDTYNRGNLINAMG